DDRRDGVRLDPGGGRHVRCQLACLSRAGTRVGRRRVDRDPGRSLSVRSTTAPRRPSALPAPRAKPRTPPQCLRPQAAGRQRQLVRWRPSTSLPSPHARGREGPTSILRLSACSDNAPCGPRGLGHIRLWWTRTLPNTSPRRRPRQAANRCLRLHPSQIQSPRVRCSRRSWSLLTMPSSARTSMGRSRAGIEPPSASSAIRRRRPSDDQSRCCCLTIDCLKRLVSLRRSSEANESTTSRRSASRRAAAPSLSLSVSPIKDQSGRVIGGAKIARDISLRRQLERQREQDLAQEQHGRSLAEAANRAKDAFLAMVSHELRSPLSPILSWTRMLRMKALDEAKSERALETIERSARAQAKLIDDLLDISRIVAGKLRLEVRSVDLASVIEQAVEVARPAADAKQIRLQIVLDTETGPVSGDPARLQQVVWNLLSNAVKFTPKSGRIQITLERVNSQVEIAVSDTGQGVPAEFLPHLFERFQQAQSGTTRSPGGLGLGLAIVRHIVELHGGTVFAESAGEGQGATFTVKLPRTIFMRTAGEAERRHPTLGPLPEPTGLPSLHDLRVLVVDDEPDSNEVRSTVLAAAGAEVRVAASAAEGLEELKRWTPHVIISDIGMPNEDGYMFLAKLHALPGETAHIPVVALTAYATTEDRVRIFSAGFKAH